LTVTFQENIKLESMGLPTIPEKEINETRQLTSFFSWSCPRNPCWFMARKTRKSAFPTYCLCQNKPNKKKNINTTNKCKRDMLKISSKPQLLVIHVILRYKPNYLHCRWPVCCKPEKQTEKLNQFTPSWQICVLTRESKNIKQWEKKSNDHRNTQKLHSLKGLDQKFRSWSHLS